MSSWWYTCTDAGYRWGAAASHILLVLGAGMFATTRHCMVPPFWHGTKRPP